MKLYFLICTLVLIATSYRTHGFYYGEEDDDSSSGINKTFTGTYLIVAPKNVRPGLPYAVSVNYLKTEDSKPISINLRILDENNKTVVQKVEDVHAGKPVTVKIDKVPNTLVDGIQYRLRVSGQDHSKKQLFESDRRLNYNAKGLSVFVQSDKKIYKPGSAVHFRVVCVYPDLKPYKGVASIKVTDPNQNVLMKFGNVSFEHGVIGKEDKMKIQLTEEPPLGEWKITVDVAGQKTEYDFTVDKYVLPKFEVTVKPPPYMLLTDDLAVTVSAKYTYGKGVAGTATLFVEFPNYWYRDEDKPKSISKTIDLDKNGEVVIRIPNGALKENKLLNTENYWPNNLQLTATVTEGLTGIQRNGTASVSAYKQPYNVEISKQGETFQPGLDYTYTVVVKTKDDKPLPDSANHKINMTVNYLFPYTTDENGTSTRNEPVVQSEEITLDKDGTKSVTIRTLNNATSISIQANYNNQNETSTSYELRPSTYIEASKSPTQSYLQITQESASIHAGDVAKFKVKATGAEIKTLTAQVMTRGYMVFIKNVDVKDHNANVEIPTTNEMAPKSRLIVYGIRSDNKEIIVSAMDLKVEGLFRNNVSISVEPHRAEPNDNVTFNVKASPKSYIGLLAVDQSVLLLKSGNDITQQDVESDIAQYDGSGYWPWRGRSKRSICWRCGWWGISGKDAATIFDNSGVLVLTDAFLYREPQPPRRRYYSRPSLRRGGGGASRSSSSGRSGKLSGPPYDYGFDSEVMMEPAVVVPLSVDDNRLNSPLKSGQPEVTVRRKFPETWIWADVINGDDGHASFKANVPDTITSWITTAFAMHDEDGLGVGPEPAKLEVFRPFFIRLNLPYSVKRGEKLALQVLVFNYMTDEQTVTVTLEHNEHSPFDLLDKPGATKDKKSKDLATRIVKVAGNQGSASVFFPIVPTKVGDMKLLVKAFAQTASDAVEEKLIVEAEGFPIYKNKPFVVDLSSKDSWTTSIQLDIPQNVVPGSQKATVAFVGDIMGSLLENIDRLIQMPYGCGEQNMVNFVPNIIVRRYLEATSRLTPEQTEKTKRYMEAGYQRELSYQRDDFSYSAFGKGDKAGSTWLTAFVVRSFHQAKPYIHVDEDKLKESIKFLKTQQKENGAFGESGEVHSKALQGGSGSGGPPLTAYVYLALVENDVKNPEALNYLERSLERASNDSYTLALISYALHLAGSSKKDDAFKALEKTAIEKDGSKYWSQKVGGSDAKDAPWWDQPKPVDVEMTAYALLTYVLRKDISSAVPLVRWLVSKQNSYGGYSSTQDTVVALQALGAYAEKAYTPNIEVSATVKNGDQKHTFSVKKDNAIILQQYQISNLDKPVEINAKGKGISFGHVGWHYNLLQLADSQPFICSKDVSQTSSNDILLNMCCKYNLEGRSNMALMQVESPSGFIIDKDKLNKLTQVRDLQRVETERNDQQANIYFNSLSNEQICFNVSAERQFFVSEQKPANVKLIDYYHPSHQIAFDYSISKKLDLNEVCGGDCWKDMGKGNTGDNIVYANSDSLSLPSSSENLAICQCLKFVLTLLLPLFLIYA